MNRLFFLMFAAVIGLADTSGAATNNFFAEGMALSRAGQFPEAAAAFEKAARSQPASGTLVNLGLAEWQRGHAGEAIRAWEQARWIDPFEQHALQNLKFASAVAQVDEPQLKWFETASIGLPPNDWVWLAGASLWLALGALVLPRIFRRKKSGWTQALAALSFSLFIFALVADFGVVSRIEIGFVLKRNTALLLTPTHSGEVIATLNSGEAARRLRTHGRYFFIRTANAAGWIERDNFGLVSE